MLKQYVNLEVKKGERSYSLPIAIDAPLGEVHDVLFEMISYIVSRINDAAKAASEKKSSEISPEQEK